MCNYSFCFSRFVEAELEYGFERFMHRDHMKGANHKSNFKRYTAQIHTELAKLKNESTGIIPALEILQVGYNEMKEHLDKAGPSEGLLPTTTIMEEIMTGVDNIEKNLKPPSSKEKTKEGHAKKKRNSESDDDIGLKRSKIKQKGFKKTGQGYWNGTSSSDTEHDEETEKKLPVSKRYISPHNKRVTITAEDNCIKLVTPNRPEYNHKKKVWLKRTVHRQLDTYNM